MAAPAGSNASQDCQMKSGQITNLQIIFAETYDFKNPIVVDANITQLTGGPLAKEHSFSFLMKGKTGNLTVRENVDRDAYQAFVRISRDAFTVAQYNNHDTDGNQSHTYTIHLTIKSGFTLLVETDGNKKRLPNRRNWDPKFLDVLQNNTLLWRRRSAIEKARHIKVIVPGYNRVRVPGIFDENNARKILNQELLTDYRVVPAQFVRLHKKAMQGEDDLKKQKQNSLIRHNVLLKFNQLQGFTNRVYVEMQQHKDDPQWMLQGQERILFLPKAGGILDAAPTATPGKRDKSFWRGTVFFRDGAPCATIDNVLTPALLTAMRPGSMNGGITIKFDDEEDPVAERALKALSHLEAVMSRQLNADYAINDPSIRSNYRIPPAGIMMPFQRGLIKRDVSPWNVTGSNLAALLQLPAYQFLKDSHKKAVENTLRSSTGISLIEGPPATGKTELIAKLIGFTLKHVDMPKTENIVLSAHTNVAVSVACQRFLKICTPMFGLDKNIVCLIWSENKAEYGRLVEKDLPQDLKDITLDAHIHRLANQNRNDYTGYLRGYNEIKSKGRIEDKPTRRKYLVDIRNLVDLVKQYVRVWFCTLATFHLEQWVFGTEKGWTGIHCALLIIDEASQAHPTAAWLPWHVLNPRRIVFAGDHKQLAPHCESTEAEWAWKTSLFEQLREDSSANVSSVVLDLQFRTVQNIYAGTNVFYNNVVQSHQSTAGRQLYSSLMAAAKRIHFVDAKNVKHQLSLNTHWFDIQNGVTTTKGETSSSTNNLERRFLSALFSAFYKCGIPATSCLLLTGYQAMFDDLVDADRQFPVGGTTVKKVDGAQGDEAGVVGITLVRTFDKGLGFMANARRQNVMTSRAKDGMYGVGQVNAMHAAHGQGSTAWIQWFNNMVSRNGAVWCIKFHAPVTFYVDGNVIPGPDDRPPPTDQQGVSASSTIEIENAIHDNEIPPPGATNSGPNSPQGPDSRRSSNASQAVQSHIGSRPGTPVQSPQRGLSSPESLPGTPIQSPPHAPGTAGSPGSPSTSSPRIHYVPNKRQASIGEVPPIFQGAASVHGGTRQSSGSTPRRPSLLNPEHGRSVSGTVAQGNEQSLPMRPAERPQFWTNDAVASRLSSIMGSTKDKLRNDLTSNLEKFKKQYSAANWQSLKETTEKLYKALLGNDPVRFNSIIDGMINANVNITNIENTATIAYAKARLWNISKGLVPWP